VFGILFEELLHTHIWSKFELGDGAILVGNTLVSTFIILFIGELVPKAMFKARAASLINTFAPVAQFFHILFKPLTVILVNTAQWVLSNLLQVKMAYKKEAFTKVDLAHFVQQTNPHQEQQELNTDLFENALSLPDIKVRKCLVPRTEIIGVDLLTPISELKALFIETKLSKLIVYNDTLDNIVGYVHQLDLFKKPTEIKAIALANDSIYGLAASVWTSDLKTAHRMVAALEAGVVWVNCFGDGDMTQPFGGYKQSGNSRDKHMDSLLSYMQTKSAWFHMG
jgi:CBS domain containing-hemolysin-like protein